MCLQVYRYMCRCVWRTEVNLVLFPRNSFCIIRHMSVLSARMLIYQMCAAPTAIRRGCGISCNWIYRWLLVAVWVLGTNPGSLQEQPVLLTVRHLLAASTLLFETGSVRCLELIKQSRLTDQ